MIHYDDYENKISRSLINELYGATILDKIKWNGIVYLVGMSEEWEMSKKVNEKWPPILSWKLSEKT